VNSFGDYDKPPQMVMRIFMRFTTILEQELIILIKDGSNLKEVVAILGTTMLLPYLPV